MARVLYISYTGLLDPLGASQVLQYVLGLSTTHQISLLTFEKTEAMADHARLDKVSKQCSDAGVQWTRLIYHRRFGLPAKILDIANGIRTGIRLARSSDAEIIHCRSYIAGLMGLAVKRSTGAKYVFDMRGFWPDERVEGEIWKRNSLPYRVFKRAERHLFLGADHVVSLTRSGAREIRKFDYLQGCLPPISVIPTCTNLELFSPSDRSNQGFTLGYVGSVGSWYMFEEVAKAVGILFDRRPDARFLVVNKGGHEVIRDTLIEAGVDLDRVDIETAVYSEVGNTIGRMDAGIFFIKPVWSKRASCPTRMGEFLACGKPCLANGPVGDVAEDFVKSNTGVVVERFDHATLDRALRDLEALAREPDIRQRCRALAKQKFALEVGVEEYDRIYKALTFKSKKAP